MTNRSDAALEAASPQQRPLEARSDEPTERVRPEHVRALRLGHGANCSSVGSVIDTLFLGAAVGGAIFAAVCAAMREEPLRVVGARARDDGARATAVEPSARRADGELTSEEEDA